MTNEQVQKKLNLLQKIANQLAREAKKRYGADGLLFYEADGAFHFMSHDDGANGIASRQGGIIMSSVGYTDMDCGAW